MRISGTANGCNGAVPAPGIPARILRPRTKPGRYQYGHWVYTRWESILMQDRLGTPVNEAI